MAKAAGGAAALLPPPFHTRTHPAIGARSRGPGQQGGASTLSLFAGLLPVLTASRPRALTATELRVLKAAAAGLTVDGTAERLERRPETVRTHRKRILALLGAVNMTHAVALSFARGILGEPSPETEPIRDGQISAFHAKCGTLDRRFNYQRGSTKAETLELASARFGRTIESVSDLSRGEASQLLDHLEEQLG